MFSVYFSVRRVCADIGETVHGIFIIITLILSVIPPSLGSKFSTNGYLALSSSCLLSLLAASYFLYLAYIDRCTPRSVEEMYTQHKNAPSIKSNKENELIHVVVMWLLSVYPSIRFVDHLAPCTLKEAVR